MQPPKIILGFVVIGLLVSCGGPDKVDMADQQGDDKVDEEDFDPDPDVGEDDPEDETISDDDDSVPESDILDGPATRLLIDGSVHTGTDWSGAPYVGVWGEPFDFDMADYPVTWAIATAHASLLLRSRQIDYSPNAVLSVAIKESRLGCTLSSFPNDDGCFQIERTTAYTELKLLFSNRFSADHSLVIKDEHFESSAIALAYYDLFSMAMFHLHSTDPSTFFTNHPDPYAELKVISAAYNRGLWWSGLGTIFKNCSKKDVTQCFEGHQIAIDHATAIANYTKGLDAATPFDVPLTLDDFLDYWDSIKTLYPDADEDEVLDVLGEPFDGGKKTISFNKNLKAVLKNLMEVLPSFPTHDEAVKAVCGRGYIWASPPCP